MDIDSNNLKEISPEWAFGDATMETFLDTTLNIIQSGVLFPHHGRGMWGVSGLAFLCIQIFYAFRLRVGGIL
jgi:hypothetical protein